jgi:hypothetical protein
MGRSHRHGARTYTYTNTFKITYVDATGSHTILGFMVSACQGSITRGKTMSGDTYFFLGSSFSSSQTANRPTISTPVAIGNLLTLRLAKNLTSSASGSLAAEWTETSYVNPWRFYSIAWTGSQSRSISGPVNLYFGSVLIDSANISIGHDDTVADSTTGRAPTDAGGNVNGQAIIDSLPDVTQDYDRDETTFSVKTWTNIEDAAFALIYSKTRYVESWDRVDILYSEEALLQLWQADGNIARYFQRCEVTPYPAPTVSDS